MIEHIERTGEVVGPFETRVVAKDGGERIVISTSCRIPEPLGGHSYVCMDVDTTERKRSELERDSALDNLRRSNRDLQDFAFVAAHDLQEPLRKVRAFGGRLREEYGDAVGERGHERLDRITSAAVRMQRLIEDLLGF